MDMVILLESFAGLLGLLAILIFFLIYSPKKHEAKKRVIKKSKEHFGDDFKTLESLADIIRNHASSSKELENAIDLILKHHGVIHPKLGIRAHPDFTIYGEIMLRICRHRNTNKKLILKFDRELTAKNEEYKKDISDFLTKGLDSRGA